MLRSHLLHSVYTFLLTLCLASTSLYAQLAGEVPKEAQGVGVDQKPGETLPLDAKVKDSRGRSLRLGQLFEKGKPVLFTLNYSSCPMLCSVQLNQLVLSLDSLDLKLGQDYQLITLSIDPNETTETIRETKKKYVSLLPNQPLAETGWHFATASQGEISRVTDALGFRYRYDDFSGEYYHPAMVGFISPEGVITSYSLDVAFPEDQMRMAIVDASNGAVGSIVDQVLMLCFRYDSQRNKYVGSAWGIMRLAGLTTVAVLVATLTPFWIGRKRSHPHLEGAGLGDSDAGADSDAVSNEK